MDDRFLYGKHFPRSREHKILVPLSIMGVWKMIKNLLIVDECHVTLFVQALSLELAALAINIFVLNISESKTQ